VAKHDVEKLKTIGDAYMCVAGVPAESRGHAITACLASLEIQHHMERTNMQREKMRMPRWDMRIGLHSGPIIAGVVGEKKFTFDVWGDAVNIAALMEKEGELGRVNVSQTTFQQVSEAFETEERGEIDSGKKGLLTMYFVNRLKPEFSSDKDGIKPNEEFQQQFGNLLRVYDR
jgi:class 3 adenylate cyclase